jgi:hypothetical protein
MIGLNTILKAKFVKQTGLIPILPAHHKGTQPETSHSERGSRYKLSFKRLFQ